jgi:hypothetical protein
MRTIRFLEANATAHHFLLCDITMTRGEDATACAFTSNTLGMGPSSRYNLNSYLISNMLFCVFYGYILLNMFVLHISITMHMMSQIMLCLYS